MATTSDITTGVQTVSAAGAVTGSLDTSGLSGDYTIAIHVPTLGAGKKMVVAVEDTANATPYSDKVQVAVFHFVGKLTSATDEVIRIKKYQIPATRFGATNTALRINVLAADSSPAATIHAWLEQ